ncbi:ATP-binding protein [Thalassospiraceae bacterium LMO-JJ14]|nr:ATP-binding protein [Thalassospiraceae bacterium LMO-JJ14]
MIADSFAPEIQNFRLLLVEDNEFDRATIETEFSRRTSDVTVMSIESVKKALETFNADQFDAVVTDIALPDGSGLDVIVFIRSKATDIPILALTGFGSEEMAVDAIKRGANDYLVKSRDTYQRLPKLIADMLREKLPDTVRTQTTAEIDTLQARFRDFAEAASDWFWETDRDHRIRFVSDSIKEVHGIQPHEIIGTELNGFLISGQPDHRAELERSLSEASGFKDLIFDIRTPLGDVHAIRLNGKPYFSDTDEFRGFRGIGTDITADIQSAIELNAAKIEAEEANKAKTRFLAVMSHEIRTPLNGILGFTQALQTGIGGPINEKQADYLNDIAISGEHLLSVLNDILDISKIEANQYELTFADVDVADEISSIIHIARPNAEIKKVFLQLGAVDVDTCIKADQRALRQILLNLVSNAIKFTQENDKITISAIRNGDDLVISVADTGIGIDANDIDKIAKPFHQIENVLSRRHEGTGLGLSIVKGLTEAHGGTMSVESAIGEGTIIRILLPLHHGSFKGSVH